MKRGIYILVVTSLLIGLVGAVGCTGAKEGLVGSSPETGSFSTVITMNGKELTVGAPTIAASVGQQSSSVAVTVVVKNSCSEPINVAEVEMVLYRDGDVYETQILIWELFPGDVQTLVWYPHQYIGHQGSLKVKVKRLE